MKTLEDALKIADIHADRLEWAANALSSYFPITASKLENLSYDDIMKLELYTSRFARLQDQLGRKVFPLLLKSLGDFDESMNFRDILAKLEKLHIVESAEEWHDLRETRNDISHEYPDDHDKMATALNESYKKRHILLDCLRVVHKENLGLKR